MYLTETGLFGRGYGLVGPRLGISFLPWSVLAPELAGEGHGQVELSRGMGGREPEVRRTRMTLEVKTRDFKEQLSLWWSPFPFPKQTHRKRKTQIS